MKVTRRLVSLVAVVSSGFMFVRTLDGVADDMSPGRRVQALGLAFFGRRHSRKQPEDVLRKIALSTFRSELPHWLHGTVESLLRLLQPWLPDVGSAIQIAAIRHELQKPGSQAVLVDDSSRDSPHCEWRNMLHELCHVLGFAREIDLATEDEQEAENIASMLSTGIGRQDEALTKETRVPMCPELWVDEGSSPSHIDNSQRGSRNAPVWSAGTGLVDVKQGRRDRGVIVLRAVALQSFPDDEVKALIGYELGVMMWQQLPTALPPKLMDGVAKLYMAFRVYLQFRQALPPTPQPPWWSGAFGHTFQSRHVSREADTFARLFGLITNQRNHGSTTAARGLFNHLVHGPVAPITDLTALDKIMGRAVPWIIRPMVYGAVMANGGPRSWLSPLGALADPVRQRLQDLGSKPTASHRSSFPAPFAGLSGAVAEAIAMQSFRAAASVHSRSAVVTADRVAALAAGDAFTAAMALLRAQGLVTEGMRTKPEEIMRYMASTAERQTWKLRFDATVLAAATPSVEVRMRELLQWSHTYTSKRLIAFAELRRSNFRPVDAFWPRIWHARGAVDALVASRWFWFGRSAMLFMLVLPLVVRIDLIRWSTACTFCITACGMAVVLFMDGAGLPFPAGLMLLVASAIYAYNVRTLWWNHLLGNTRQWAELSSRLSSQLSEHSDVTAGIACLTREWAEMAQRSLVALDEELCGSWRSSLSEVASKLLDLQQEIESGGNANEATRGASLNASMGSHLPLQRAHTSSFPSVALAVPMPTPQRHHLHHSFTFADRTQTNRHAILLKVDRMLQRSLSEELGRMKSALAARDLQELQPLMTWWVKSAGNTSIRLTAFSAHPDMRALLPAPFEERGGNAEGAETLGALLMAKRLSSRYPYPGTFMQESASSSSSSMHNCNEMRTACDEDLRSFQAALTATAQSMESLQARLAPLTTKLQSARCPRFSDMWSSLAHICSVLVGASGRRSNSESDECDTIEERAALRRYVLCFAAAITCGSTCVFLALPACMWCWAMAGTAFAIANAVLLLNFNRLSLPHVHTLIERRLDELSRQRERLYGQLQSLQCSSQRDQLAHAKASVMMQSVNFLRNINYVLLCIKMESRRATHHQAGFEGVQRGLQLLCALLPRSDPSWHRELLTDDDCGQAAALLQWQLAIPGAEIEDLQQRIVEAQRRLLIMFRMVADYPW